MQLLNLDSGPTHLKFAKKMFKDVWGLSQDGNEVGLLRFTMLRTKTIGTRGEDEFPIVKDGKGQSVTRDGKTLATYEGKMEGHLAMADGSVLDVTTKVVTSLPGAITIKMTPPGGEPVVWAETTWNMMGIPKTELVIEPGAPKDDALWGAIFSLMRIIVVNTLFRSPLETGLKAERASIG